MLSETVYTGITNLHIIMKNQKYIKQYIINVNSVFLKSRVFSFFLNVSTLLQPRSSSVNSSFHRRGTTTANAFSEHLFDFSCDTTSKYTLFDERVDLTGLQLVIISARYVGDKGAVLCTACVNVLAANADPTLILSHYYVNFCISYTQL